ncbi:MAG TPA: VOC family protein [Ramlibacter sp.]|nr:VOC family protein [Ramlibacter sp.]
MPGSIPTVSHVSIGTNDYARAKSFYDAVLATLGIQCIMDIPGAAAGYGRQFPAFWIGGPHDGGKATAGNGVHVCFFGSTEDEVKAFHAKVLELGGTDEGAPGLRPDYGPNYYGAFARDLDGNKIEAMVFQAG